MFRSTCKKCGAQFFETSKGARDEDLCDGCEKAANTSLAAKPYIDTAKPGDVLRVDTCDNPRGWWSVLRNDRPIHHFPDKDDAEALCYAIASAEISTAEGR